MNNDSLKSFLTFKQGYNRGLVKAPHKPILMLAVIEAFEKGYITENMIPISPELVSLFKSYWEQLVTTGHTANFALPFFHLKNEKKSNIWHLEVKPGFEGIITKSRSIKSFKALKDYVYFARLNGVFFKFILDKTNRKTAKNYILERYFNLDSVQLKYNYIEKYELELFSEDPELYKAKMKHKTIEAEEEYIQEMFIRRGAFKMAIPKVYRNTCAVTGLRIVSNPKIAMIDACHIVPFSESHDDTIGNGIALCPNMHRAFDRGLISIDEDFRVLISNHFKESDSTYSLSQFDRKEILLPPEKRFYPKQENLEVHRLKFEF
jgi:putative restriction endonuclease